MSPEVLDVLADGDTPVELASVLLRPALEDVSSLFVLLADGVVGVLLAMSPLVELVGAAGPLVSALADEVELATPEMLEGELLLAMSDDVLEELELAPAAVLEAVGPLWPSVDDVLVEGVELVPAVEAVVDAAPPVAVDAVVSDWNGAKSERISDELKLSASSERISSFPNGTINFPLSPAKSAFASTNAMALPCSRSITMCSISPTSLSSARIVFSSSSLARTS